MDTNVSSTVVPTCNARTTNTSREMFRCRPAVRNRGHRSLLNRPAVITPTSTLAVNSSSVTSPAARVAYHMPGPCRSTGSTELPGRSRRRAGWPASHDLRGAVVAYQPRGQAGPGQPGRSSFAAQDRRRARRVRIHAGRRGYADCAPARLRGQAGGRHDDVVQPGAAAPPATDRGARGGQPASADHPHMILSSTRPTVEADVVGDAHPPPVLGRGTGYPDVAAQVDQDPA